VNTTFNTENFTKTENPTVWGVFVGEGGGEFESLNSQAGPFPPSPGTEGWIAIGWPAIGDMNMYDMNYPDFVEKFRKIYGHDYKGERELMTAINMVWNFAYEMKKGHLIICPVSANGLLFVGEITGEYEPDFHNKINLRNRRADSLHMRKVRWLYIIEKNDPRHNKLNRIGQLTITKPDIKAIDLLTICNSIKS
jgi:hypothetical protein